MINKNIFNKLKQPCTSFSRMANLIKILALRNLYSVPRLLLGLIFCAGNSLATHPVELEETPLNFYTSQQCPCFIGAIKYSEQLPEKYYLTMSGVKNQGPLGTCVSFATSACAEYHYKHKFSEAEFTVLAQTHKLGNKCEGGLFLGNALRVAMQYGLVLEPQFLYSQYVQNVAFKNGIDINAEGWEEELSGQEDAQVCNINDYNGTMEEFGIDLALEGNPKSDYTSYRLNNLRVIHHVSRNALTQALQQYSQSRTRDLGRRLAGLNLAPSSASSSSRAPTSVGTPLQADIESVEKALYCGRPVVAAIDVYKNCWDNPSSLNGYQIMMPQQEDSVEGSHAIVITGFDYTRKMFKIKNSWGSDWGNKGYAELPYDYLKLYSTELVAVGVPRRH